MERIQIHSTVFIGDSMGDAEGAREVGLSFIVAKYGFGLNWSRNTYKCVCFVNNPMEILNFL